MNHDYTHCLDCNENCPDKCFRKQLVDDLENTPYPHIFSWAHLKGSGFCMLSHDGEEEWK